MFEQILDPTGHVWLSVFVSLVPLIALLFMLAALRMTAWLASIIVGVITIPIGVYVWHAPLAGTLKSYLYGGLTGFWVIDWITFWGLIIFNTLVLTGDFERFKNWMIHHATADIRIQTIMLAWAFGALLEGLVGFGYPWAVVVPILVGLGIADLDAIRVAALANNAPVSYGALGAPILGLAAVTGLPMLALSASIGNVVAVLALLPPWVLIYLVSGWEGVTEAWPLAIVGSLSYILGQWPSGSLFGTVPAGFERGVGFLLGFIYFRESMAAEDDSRIRRQAARGAGDFGSECPGNGKHAAGIELLDALPGVDPCRCGVDRPVVASAGIQFDKADRPGHLFRHAHSHFLNLQFCAARGRHFDPGFLADYFGNPAAQPPAIGASFFAHVQADVGRAARRVFYFCAGLHFCLYRDGELAGVRTF